MLYSGLESHSGHTIHANKIGSLEMHGHSEFYLGFSSQPDYDCLISIYSLLCVKKLA